MSHIGAIGGSMAPAAKPGAKAPVAGAKAPAPGAKMPPKPAAKAAASKPSPPPVAAAAQPAVVDDALLGEAAAALAAFSLHDKDLDGHLNFREFAGFVKGANEEVPGFIDDSNLPVYIKREHRAAATDGLVSPAEFVKWHAAFLSARGKWEEEQAAKMSARATASGGTGGAVAAGPPASFGGAGVWECSLDQLQLALDSAYAQKRTPLILGISISISIYINIAT
jgi:hypothetical protein